MAQLWRMALVQLEIPFFLLQQRPELGCGLHNPVARKNNQARCLVPSKALQINFEFARQAVVAPGEQAGNLQFAHLPPRK
jgi:hypothetical protein